MRTTFIQAAPKIFCRVNGAFCASFWHSPQKEKKACITLYKTMADNQNVNKKNSLKDVQHPTLFIKDSKQSDCHVVKFAENIGLPAISVFNTLTGYRPYSHSVIVFFVFVCSFLFLTGFQHLKQLEELKQDIR